MHQTKHHVRLEPRRLCHRARDLTRPTPLGRLPQGTVDASRRTWMNREVCNGTESGEPASLVGGATAAQVIGGLVTQMSPLVIGGPRCASQSRRPSEALATACAALAD